MSGGGPLAIQDAAGRWFQLNRTACCSCVRPEWFGAVADGVTNDTAAINAAAIIWSGVEVQFSAGKSYFTSTGVTCPGGAKFRGFGFCGLKPDLFTGGARILAPQNIATPAVTLGSGNVTTNPAAIEGIIIQGVGVATLTQGIGLKLDGVRRAIVRDVSIDNFYQGMYVLAYNTAGLGTYCQSVYIWDVQDASLINDSYAEITFEECRFSGNLGHTTSLRFVQQNYANLGAGANTVVFIGCQFNPGGATAPTYLAQYLNNAGPSNATNDFKFIGCHIEYYQYGFFSDSSWLFLNTLFMADNHIAINGGGTQAVVALNAATKIVRLKLSNNMIHGSTFSLTSISSASIENSIVANSVNPAVTISNDGTGGKLSIIGNDSTLPSRSLVPHGHRSVLKATRGCPQRSSARCYPTVPSRNLDRTKVS